MADRPSPSRRKELLAVNFGQALEYFDFTIFAIFAIYFSSQFFHGDSDVSNLLSTLAVFGLGFVARPIGGIVFGRLADRRGRTLVLVLTISISSLCCLLTAVAPTYGMIGAGASVWIVVVRIALGMAQGGEQGSSVTYVGEAVPAARRGFLGSTNTAFVVVGLTLATLLGALLSTLLTKAEMTAWGWRIPFIIGAVLGVFVLYLRRSLAEPETFTRTTTGDVAESATLPEAASSVAPVAAAARGEISRRGTFLLVLRAIVVTGSTLVFGYQWSVMAPTYAITFHKVNPTAAMWVGVVATVLYGGAILLSGRLSDKIGRRGNLIIYGVLVAALSFPLSGLLSSSAWTLLIAMCLANVVLAFGTGMQVAWLSEQFATRTRGLAISGTLAFSSAIFGGTAAYLNTWLTARGTPQIFTWYVIATAVATIILIAVSRETKGISLASVGRTNRATPAGSGPVAEPV
ncbi:MFS transporter [Pseudonocardia ailaonensis]|uniref:MFS transporter n=1 Tax=Pseudonocardia ailaonensis TaxID=367279 RepID=A0ABN2MYL6_9PSEU